MLRPRNKRAPWTLGEVLMCALWLGSVALGSCYAIRNGLNADQLFMTLFVGTLVALGVYDTRHDQPTLHNLLRAWPLGTAADDERRGQQTVYSQALHVLMGLSMCLCLLQVVLKQP